MRDPFEGLAQQLWPSNRRNYVPLYLASKTSDEFVLVMVPLWVPTGMRN